MYVQKELWPGGLLFSFFAGNIFGVGCPYSKERVLLGSVHTNINTYITYVSNSFS